ARAKNGPRFGGDERRKGKTARAWVPRVGDDGFPRARLLPRHRPCTERPSSSACRSASPRRSRSPRRSPPASPAVLPRATSICRCHGCSARCSPPWRCRLPAPPCGSSPGGRPPGTWGPRPWSPLQVTATVVAKLVTLLPLIIGAAFFSTIVGAIGGLLYMRLTGIDRVTAFFATVPGGVVETTTIAPHYGGHLEPIMVAQTTRVALIVVFAP